MSTLPPPRRHPSIESAWVVDRYVLFDARTGVIHELSPSASAVWALVDVAHSATAVAATLTKQVGRDVTADVRDTLAEFDRLGLLSDAAGDPA